MKQRMVIRVLNSSKKNQSKAMKLAAAVQGVETVSFQGGEKDQIMVIGEGIDAVNLTFLLRKKLGLAELISVIPIAELEILEEETTRRTTTMQPTVYPTDQVSTYPTYQPGLPPYYIQDVGMRNQESCVIL
ncbi:hypothetical protein ACH5RR_024040 [Cinchona calisaya]|uniref:Uncharacterized protein n=1 Tax=Cinchona calisaya TaxID=153742 RepID=A0ABD2ZCG6_9GENT